MTEQEAAIQQVRETLIKAGIEFAVRLRYLRSVNKDYNIAMSTSGTLAIIVDDNNHYRFGSASSNRVQAADSRMVGRWNQQHPDHPVELVSIQRALEAECSRVFLLLHEIQQNIERTGG
jgi:hypothetical protein